MSCLFILVELSPLSIAWSFALTAGAIKSAEFNEWKAAFEHMYVANVVACFHCRCLVNWTMR